jgi:hypothetical protein
MVYEIKDQDVTPPEPNPDDIRSSRNDAAGAFAIPDNCRIDRRHHFLPNFVNFTCVGSRLPIPSPKKK